MAITPCKQQPTSTTVSSSPAEAIATGGDQENTHLWTGGRISAFAPIRELPEAGDVSPVEKTSENSLPKIISRVWVGGNMPEEYLYNALLDAHLNPTHQIIIHTDNRKYIASVLDKMMMEYEMRPQFREMAKKYGSKIEIKLVQDLEKRLKDAGYADAAKLMAAAERERYPGSPFHNYAAAADIYRLILEFLDGGIYKDADVMSKCPLPENTNKKFAMAYADEGYNNNLLVAQPRNSLVKQCMDRIVAAYTKVEKTFENLSPHMSDDELEKLYCSTWDAKRWADKSNAHGRRMFWGISRSYPRKDVTMDTTGPCMVTSVFKKAGKTCYSWENNSSKFNIVEEHVVKYDDIGGHTKRFVPMTLCAMKEFSDKIKKYPPKRDDVLFSDYQTGQDAGGEWSNILIKRRTIEGPF